MASEINFLQFDPVYRQLQKLKVKARQENVSPEINAEIERIIDLIKVSGCFPRIHVGFIYYF